MDIRARVQAHPARAHLRSVLLDALAPLPTEVIEHSSEPPSPWAGYQRCIADLPGCTHVLVIQDDALPCANFAAAVEQIATAQTSTPVCLFMSRLVRTTPTSARAIGMGRRYVTVPWRGYMPVVAVLWPRQKLVELEQYTAEHPTLPGNRDPRSDDAMAGRWKMITRQTVLATVPCLVEHSAVPSLVANDGKGGRRAAFLADDGLAYDWSRP